VTAVPPPNEVERGRRLRDVELLTRKFQPESGPPLLKVVPA